MLITIIIIFFYCLENEKESHIELLHIYLEDLEDLEDLEELCNKYIIIYYMASINAENPEEEPFPTTKGDRINALVQKIEERNRICATLDQEIETMKRFLGQTDNPDAAAVDNTPEVELQRDYLQRKKKETAAEQRVAERRARTAAWVDANQRARETPAEKRARELADKAVEDLRNLKAKGARSLHGGRRTRRKSQRRKKLSKRRKTRRKRKKRKTKKRKTKKIWKSL